MESQQEQLLRAYLWAYLKAVLAAAALFCVLMFLHRLYTYPDMTASVSRLGMELVNQWMLFVAYVVYTLRYATIPFVVAVCISVKWNIFQRAYYIAGAVLTALCLTPSAARTYHADTPHLVITRLMLDHPYMYLACGSAGLLAGWMCWSELRKKLQQPWEIKRSD